MHERICASCSERTNKCVRWCSQHRTQRTHLHMQGAHNTCRKCMHTLRKKCICTRACAHMQRYRNFFAMKAITKLSWVFPPFCFPPAQLPARRNQSPDTVRSRNSSKSTLAHDAVAAAVLHTHHSTRDHLRWCGCHPVCLWFTLALGRGPHPRQSSILPSFLRAFFSESFSNRLTIPRRVNDHQTISWSDWEYQT